MLKNSGVKSNIAKRVQDLRSNLLDEGHGDSPFWMHCVRGTEYQVLSAIVHWYLADAGNKIPSGGKLIPNPKLYREKYACISDKRISLSTLLPVGTVRRMIRSLVKKKIVYVGRLKELNVKKRIGKDSTRQRVLCIDADKGRELFKRNKRKIRNRESGQALADED